MWDGAGGPGTKSGPQQCRSRWPGQGFRELSGIGHGFYKVDTVLILALVLGP